MTATVLQLPGTAPAREVPGLNLSPDEVAQASGGYVRASDQLRALHQRGFTRAYIPTVGRKRVVLERAHYDAVVRGQFGVPRAPEAAPQVQAPPAWEETPLGHWQQEQRVIKAELDAARQAAEAAAAAEEAAERARLTPADRRALKQARLAAERAHRAALSRFHSAKRRTNKMLRTPAWADLDAIRRIYEEAHRLTSATGIAHQVDHVIPLQGRLVSGLHVHNNLQILTGSENSKKRNRFTPA